MRCDRARSPKRGPPDFAEAPGGTTSVVSLDFLREQQEETGAEEFSREAPRSLGAQAASASRWRCAGLIMTPSQSFCTGSHRSNCLSDVPRLTGARRSSRPKPDWRLEFLKLIVVNFALVQFGSSALVHGLSQQGILVSGGS